MAVKWVFFDVGSTLTDESACEAARIADTVRGSDVTEDEFDRLYRAFCARNLDGYNLARERFGLAKARWRTTSSGCIPARRKCLPVCRRSFASGS